MPRRTRWYRVAALVAFVGVLALLLGGGLAQAGKPVKPPKPPKPDPEPVNIALAFARDHNLTVMDSSGGSIKTLVRSRDIYAIAWSPDGARIAFVRRGDDGDGQLWIVDADGSNQVKLAEGLDSGLWWSDGSRLCWFPSGDKFMYASNGELYVRYADSTPQDGSTPMGVGPLFRGGVGGGALTPDLDASQAGWQGWLIFHAGDPDEDTSDPTPSDLWTVWVEEVSPSSFAVQSETLQRHAMTDYGDSHPVLTRDGTQLAFSSGVPWVNHDRPLTARCIAPFDMATGRVGDHVVLLESTVFGEYMYGYTWSPDGDWYAACGPQHGPDIIIIRPDGTGETRLTDNPKIEYHPSWNPNWINDLD